jgi:hypothetical protein
VAAGIVVVAVVAVVAAGIVVVAVVAAGIVVVAVVAAGIVVVAVVRQLGKVSSLKWMREVIKKAK